MNRFIIATSFNVQNRNKDKLGELLNNAYGASKDVTLINIDNMAEETLDKFINMGGIDCFIFSADYIKSEENKSTIKSIIRSDKEQRKNTKLINMYDSNDEVSKANSIEVGNMLLDDFSSSITHFDINTEQQLLVQSLKGMKNDIIKTKDQMKVKETEINQFLANINEMIQTGKDEYTSKHIRSVSEIANEIAIKLDMSDEERDTLKIGAMLHDIGKLDVSGKVLKKPARLDDNEFNEMKSHVVFGEVELSQYNLGKYERAKLIASEHHERYDGKGYPRGLKGDKIDKLSRIVSIADAAQAMFGRSYQSGKTKDQLISELRTCSGTQFDPKMVEALVDILENDPQSIDVSYDKDGKIRYDVKSVEEILNDSDRRDNLENDDISKNAFLGGLRNSVNELPSDPYSNNYNKKTEEPKKDYI